MSLIIVVALLLLLPYMEHTRDLSFNIDYLSSLTKGPYYY